MSAKLLQYILGIIYVSVVVSVENQGKSELRVAHKLVGGHLTAYDVKEDAELVTSSAGAGRDSKKKKNEDEKKTLSQQVADGKYGLIQTELFSKPAKRPGIISYKDNNEVPNDTAKNLGGLNKNDIWLSENHLLVIRGGTYPPHTERPGQNASAIWPPIDDYRAPQRQVKIPKHPKVPPPFPVQLTENGPLLLLGANTSTEINGSLGSQLYPLYPPENYISEDGAPDEPPRPHPADAASGQAPFPVPPYAPYDLGGYNSTDGGFPPTLNGTVPPLFNFFGPGALLPPQDNITNQYDEDDTSLYYPPPYSFYYPRDNTSKVPAGPLVPGIVLPPPPDFFAPAEDETTTIKPEAAKETTTFSTTAKTPPAITVLQPITTPRNYKQNDLQGGVVNTTRVPLKAYYSTTYKLTPHKPNRTYLPSGVVYNTQFSKTSTKPPPQYYLYEENAISTTPKQKYYNDESEFPVRQLKPPPDRQNTQYYYINGENIFDNYQTRPPIRTTKRPDTFSIHVAHLKDQIHSHHFLQQNRDYYRPQPPSSKPVYQYSFQAANYPNQRNTYRSPLQQYQVEIEEAVEVTTPVYETSQNFYYQDTATQNPVKYRGIPKTISQFSYEATPNPIYQQYYTKQDEKYIDDVTKQHFTVFGKKLPAITTPIPPPPSDLSEYVQSKPVALQQDTIINYFGPQRPINPQAEYYDVNYRPVYSEYANTNLRFPERQYGNEERKPYVTYELPGDRGTHFYFITPQLAQKRQQNASFFFTRNNASSVRDAENDRFK